MDTAVAQIPWFPRVPIRGFTLALTLGLLATVAVSAAGAGAVILVAGVAVLALLFAYPQRGAYTVFFVAVALDPGGIGFFHLLADPFWKLPPSIAEALPLKSNPFELLVAWLAFAVTVRSPGRLQPPLPGLVWAAPIVLVAGVGWGVASGGETALAYHEARGLIFAMLAFYVLMRVGPPSAAGLTRLAIGATGLLALATVLRWVLYLRGSALPMEYWFDHETGLFLAFGFIIACVAALKAPATSSRAAAVALALLTFLAVAMTGRRSGIMAIGVGVLIIGWLVMPKRPSLLVGVAVPALLVMSGYLAVYWEGHTGPLAEPARAIRSQVDPDERDRSSDEYRAVERENVQRTLQANPFLGVGFGRPYEQYERLPKLAFWPLQFHTPHQNLLWLWLKMGIVGAAVLIGLWVVAFRRCVLACRLAPSFAALPPIPLVLGAALLMALTYARVDMAFVGSRNAVVVAILLGLTFQFAGRTGAAPENRR